MAILAGAVAVSAQQPDDQAKKPRMRGVMRWSGPKGNWAPYLSETERKQLRALASESVKDARQDWLAMAKARRDLRNIYRSYSIDETAYRAAAESLSKAQYSLLRSHLDSQIRIRQVLSRSSFDSLRDTLAGKLKSLPGIGGGLDNRGSRPGWGGHRPGHSPDPSRHVLGRIASNARLLGGIYMKYDLDAKAAESLINKIHQDQVALTRQHHRQQQARRSQMTQEQFQKSLKSAPEQPVEAAPNF